MIADRDVLTADDLRWLDDEIVQADSVRNTAVYAGWGEGQAFADHDARFAANERFQRLRRIRAALSEVAS